MANVSDINLVLPPTTTTGDISSALNNQTYLIVATLVTAILHALVVVVQQFKRCKSPCGEVVMNVPGAGGLSQSVGAGNTISIPSPKPYASESTTNVEEVPTTGPNTNTSTMVSGSDPRRSERLAATTKA